MINWPARIALLKSFRTFKTGFFFKHPLKNERSDFFRNVWILDSHPITLKCLYLLLANFQIFQNTHQSQKTLFLESVFVESFFRIIEISEHLF